MIVSAEIVPSAGNATQVARDLQNRGFRVLRTDDTISVDGPESLWSDVFGVRFDRRQRPASADTPQPETQYAVPQDSTLRIPEAFQGLIDDVLFVEPPELF